MKTRYYMIVYSCRNNNYTGEGNIFSENTTESPLNGKEIKNHIVKFNGGIYSAKDIVITNIHEFKSKKDYEDFKR